MLDKAPNHTPVGGDQCWLIVSYVVSYMLFLGNMLGEHFENFESSLRN
jgi:hypothetical protein